MDIQKIAKEMEQYVIEMRRDFHRYPEMPLKEVRTCKRICEELDLAEIPYEIIGKYNVIAHLKFGDGKKLAIRADMDALPIQEELNVEWKSRNDGVMHACGHDAHTAILLATAKGLLKMRKSLTGEIYLCFQEAEEIGKCADECVEYLSAKGGVDGVIALHVQSGVEAGKIDIKPGTRCSGSEIFYIDITGKGGHGSRPDLVIDPVEVACDIYQKLKTISVYSHNPFNTIVVSPCMLSGGNRFNVFPDTAHIEGTIRYFKIGDGDLVLEHIRKICRTSAELYGAKVEVSNACAAKYPVINEKSSAERALLVAKRIGFEEADEEPSAGSDNFAEFLYAFPGCYCNIGSKSKRKGSSDKHHSACFDLDESVLPKSVEFFLSYAIEFLKKETISE